MTPTGRRTPPAEAGFALIEVLVSALVVVIVSAAVFSLMQASARSAAEDRHRSVAFAVAQEDQARLRTMRISELNRLNQKSTVNVDGTPFEVVSTGVFVNDTTADSTSCVKGSSSNDYVRITSTVSWPSRAGRPAATIQSMVSPANGSLDPTHGTLTITISNAANQPIPGITLNGTGAGTFSGITDASGCANFTDLPSGTYTVTPSGVAAGLVDKDGKTPGAFKVGVPAGGTFPQPLQYDMPGSIPKVSFTTRAANGSIVPSSADSIVVANTNMTEAKVFGTPGGSRVAAFENINPLFPFASPNTDSVYAGGCGGNNPNPKNEKEPPGAKAIANVLIPPGGAAPNAEVQLPGLEVTVLNGGAPVSGARVTISDDNCVISGNPIKRVYTTESLGHQSGATNGAMESGVPWSVYDICASASISSHNRRLIVPNKAAQNLTANTAVTIDLTPGKGSEKDKSCP